jgi:restriction system protein
MAYRKKEKSLGELLIDELIALPWWGSLVFGAMVWGMASLAIALWPKNLVVMIINSLWPVLPVLVGFTSLASAWKSTRSRAVLRRMKTLQDIREVPWQEFEQLAATYYRELGHEVNHTGQAGPDGGIDLKMRKNGKRILVQCKRYTGRSIGVQAVREFFGVVVAGGADKGIFLTTSDFTPEAMAFGLSQHSLELIPGTRFAQMVHHLRTGATAGHRELLTDPPSLWIGSPGQVVPHSPGTTPPACPRCHSRMVERHAKKGQHRGNVFWGCPQYPACTGIRPLDSRA